MKLLLLFFLQLFFSYGWCQNNYSIKHEPDYHEIQRIILPAPINTYQHCQQLEKQNKIGFFYNSNNFIADNQPGALGTGLCWWATLLNHRAAYLAELRPFVSKPTKHEVKKILHQLRLGNEFVNIPGFLSLQNFFDENKKIIVNFLSKWQRDEIFTYFKYNTPYLPNPSPSRIWQKSLNAYQMLLKNKTVFVIEKEFSDTRFFNKLKNHYIAAHSILLLNGFLNDTKDCIYFEALDTSVMGLSPYGLGGMTILKSCENEKFVKKYYPENYKPQSSFLKIDNIIHNISSAKVANDILTRNFKVNLFKNDPYEKVVFYATRNDELRRVEDVAKSQCIKIMHNSAQ